MSAVTKAAAMARHGGANAAEDSPGGVAAVDRALAIVAAIAGAEEPSSLARIAAATGYYKSTILRLLESLERAGYVFRLRDGNYVLGAMAFRLGSAYERANPLRQIVPAALRELVESGSESASFHVRQANQRICLFRVNSRHATLDRVKAGDVLPLDRGAAGRVLLAFDGVEGPAFDAIRRNHFAVSLGEREPGCAGMATPIFGPDGLVAGALSLSGPADRFTDTAIAQWRPCLLEAAAEISRSLGGHYPELQH